MDTIKDTVNYVSDKTNETLAGASKETNKQVAKDSDASLGTRASAAKDAVGDKVNEHGYGASATLNKEQAKH